MPTDPAPAPGLNETYLLIPEVAGELRVSKSTVQRLIDSRQLPSLRVGRSIRVPRSGVDRYLHPDVGAQVPDLLPTGALA